MRAMMLVLFLVLLCTAGCESPVNMPEKPPAHLVAFTASWCKPCQRNEPVLCVLESQGVSVTRIDIDVEPALASAEHVRSVPTYLVYDRDGRKVERTQDISAVVRAIRSLQP